MELILQQNIFVPILKSNVVDTEWKLSLFQSPTTEESQKLWNVHNKLFGFEEFLDTLFKTDSANLSSGELLKMELARMMLLIGKTVNVVEKYCLK